MTDRPRVVVLGGGMAGLAAAWRLSEPGWPDRFASITVVEASTRLGGKGASTRGPHGRIEEHGLHVWLGHYDNAFRMMRECYGELDRERTDPACPIRTWRDAFFPANELGVFDSGPSGWQPWVAQFSSNSAQPGDASTDSRAPSVAELLVRSAMLVRDFYASLDRLGEPHPAVTLSLSPRPPTPASRRSSTLAATLKAASQQLLVLAGQATRTLAGGSGGAAIDAAFDPILRRLRPATARDGNARRLHDLIDLVRTVVVGMVRDGLAGDRDAYDAINHLDFREWLTIHGAQPSTLRSAIVRGQYDLVFSHEAGDPNRPRFAAGWGAFLSSKLWFGYKGAIFWKMRAGMGDVVFAPLHQALTARGVRVRLLQRVDELVPSTDRTEITAVITSEPAWLPAGGQLRPLRPFKGLPCFPGELDTTCVETIEEGTAAAATRTEGGRRSRQLLGGDDFDLLVLAIPPAAAGVACRRIAAQRPEWKQMFDRLASVPTHAFQLWLRRSDQSLGWPHPGTTVSAFAKPFDTWASMPHLAELEDWPEADRPATVAYFCSTMAPEAGRSSAEARQRTRGQAIEFLEREVRHIWPRAVDRSTGGFDWDLLCGDDERRGPDRFDSQYWTANVEPSDLYVQCLPGSDRHRLRPDGAGYENLALAGDWTDSGINAGCIEAAVVSGLQAANFLLERPRWDRISGVFLR